MTVERYRKSSLMLKRAERIIPLASQTFSKSRTQYPEGATPLFIERGLGGRAWDVDGNEYVDLVSALLPVVLGHRDPAVDAAIVAQLGRGIIFSLASELEIEVAERLRDIVPCAEMARFGKNGTDATSACVRLARAFTGRDKVISCGYHGWQDWSIGATVRNKGVPKGVQALTLRGGFNDIGLLHSLFAANPGEIAALVLEPMTTVEPKPGFLEEAKALAHRNGALFVMDEVVTGFRLALGGAQERYGIVPDLAAFGKAMGNGMPIAAVVGRAEIMREMEEIFFSSTFGGETLSLAAAVAVIDKMRREPVIETLWKTGQTIADGVAVRIQARGLEKLIGLSGAAPWKVLTFQDHLKARKEAIKTLFIKEMLANGVLVNSSHNVCYAHDARDVEEVFSAYDRTLDRIGEELATGKLEERLGIPVIMPVFSVRS